MHHFAKKSHANCQQFISRWFDIYSAFNDNPRCAIFDRNFFETIVEFWRRILPVSRLLNDFFVDIFSDVYFHYFSGQVFLVGEPNEPRWIHHRETCNFCFSFQLVSLGILGSFSSFWHRRTEIQLHPSEERLRISLGLERILPRLLLLYSDGKFHNPKFHNVLDVLQKFSNSTQKRTPNSPGEYSNTSFTEWRLHVGSTNKQQLSKFESTLYFVDDNRFVSNLEGSTHDFQHRKQLHW